MISTAMIVTPSALVEIESALKQYCNAVLASDLSLGSQAIYVDHADNFVRWIKGEFEPGALARHPLKRKKLSTSLIAESRTHITPKFR